MVWKGGGTLDGDLESTRVTEGLPDVSIDCWLLVIYALFPPMLHVTSVLYRHCTPALGVQWRALCYYIRPKGNELND